MSWDTMSHKTTGIVQEVIAKNEPCLQCESCNCGVFPVYVLIDGEGMTYVTEPGINLDAKLFGH